MRPRAAGMAAALGLLLALAAPAGAESTLVSMGFSSFLPSHVEVLEGDTVAWRNTSLRTHDLRSDSAGFDSGRVARNDGFAHVFPAAGLFAYQCTIHDVMTGEVAVYGLLLSGSARKVAAGGSVALAVRAPASVSEATIEEDSGAGFRPVAVASAEGDGGEEHRDHSGPGTLHATVRPVAGSTYRAVAGERVSQTFRVELTNGPGVALAARKRDGALLLRARAAAAPPGTRAVLQLRLRERFGWWPVARARLDSRSGARFSLRRRGPLRARVVLVGADWATVLARSRTLVVRPGARAH